MNLSKFDASKKLIIDFKTVMTWFMLFAFAFITVGGLSTVPNKLRMPLFVAAGVITAGFIVFRRKKVFLTLPVVLLLLTTAYIVISIVYTIDRTITTKLAIVYVCSCLLLLADYPENFYEKAIKVFKVISIVFAFSIVLSYFCNNLLTDYLWFIVNPTRDPKVSAFIIKEIKWAGAYSGFAMERADAAFIMNVGISAYLSKYFTQKKFDFKDMFFVGILFWALILTSKRMLFVCPIIVFCFMMLISKKKGKLVNTLLIGLLVVFGVIVVGTVMPQGFHLFERFAETDSVDGLNGREFLWPHLIEMFKKKPFSGWGIGSFNEYLYINNILINGTYWQYYGHNIYYEFLGELGIIVFTMLMSGLLIMLFRTFSLFRSEVTNTKQKYLLCFSMAIQIICFVYGTTGNVLVFPQQIFMWFICLGITTTISNEFQRKGIRISKKATRNTLTWR